MDNMQIEKEGREEGKQDYLREKEIFWEIYRENRKEEEEVRLKSRSLWLKAGDKNTSFFNNSMKIRRARNQIEKIQVENQEVKGAEELKKQPTSTLKIHCQQKKKWLNMKISSSTQKKERSKHRNV